MVTTGNNWNSTEVFPSPTGVNYYESQGMEFNQMIEIIEFPSPTGVNYYESRKKEDYYD